MWVYRLRHAVQAWRTNAAYIFGIAFEIFEVELRKIEKKNKVIIVELNLLRTVMFKMHLYLSFNVLSTLPLPKIDARSIKKYSHFTGMCRHMCELYFWKNNCVGRKKKFEKRALLVCIVL